MSRLPALLVALAALALPAQASAAESFLGVLTDGRAVRFTDASLPGLSAPRAIAGVAAGDRIVAVSGQLALGRSGRVYRFDPRTLRATATAARVPLSGREFSIVTTPAGAVRVLSDAGQDTLADDETGEVLRGPGLRLADGTAIAPAVAALPDGRLAGLETHRGTLVTETAPGSGVMTEVAARPKAGRLTFPAPNAFAVAGGRGFSVSALDSRLHPQSRLLSSDLATGASTGDAGNYFFRRIVAIAALGAVPADVAAPRASFVRAPRTVSLRDLQVSGRVKLAIRCSEACIVNAGSAVGGRTNITSSRTRDTPGTVTVPLYRLSRREARLMRLRLGRTVILRAFVQDWSHNQRVVERRVRLTR